MEVVVQGDNHDQDRQSCQVMQKETLINNLEGNGQNNTEDTQVTSGCDENHREPKPSHCATILSG